jgi:hypothetical protein
MRPFRLREKKKGLPGCFVLRQTFFHGIFATHQFTLNSIFSPPTRFRIQTNAAMPYSFFSSNQCTRYSQTTGRQPVPTGAWVCTGVCGRDLWKCVGTTTQVS